MVLMKAILTYLATFVLLSFVFSALSGCTGTTANTSAPASDQTAANGAAPDVSKKKSDYPPLVSVVANADLKNLDGSTFKVTDRKGKVLILNLWATWCGPCRREMPALVRMQETFGEKLEVIGLNTDDESVEDINSFAADMKLNYTLVWADTKTQSELLKISKFGGIPQSFIIDQEGNLRGVFRGAAPADVKKMEELVALVVGGVETGAVPMPATNSEPADASAAGIDAGVEAVPVDKKPEKK
jgi:thiol-disulfide isomerase/thioredoxin